jgi:hypothetical protein
MAGLLILGTFLASLVVVRATYLHQWALAGRKQEAIAAADALLVGWWADPEKLPRQGAGDLRDQQMRWRTRLIDNSKAKDLNVDVVRLEIFENRASPVDTAVVASPPTPLAFVEIVINKRPDHGSDVKKND